MLTKLEQAQQQWGGSHTVIDRWLVERKALLIKLCQLSGLPPYQGQQHCGSADLNEFCLILMDYLSAGHFEVYEEIVSECQKHGPSSLELARNLYPQISKSTDIALAFNDKYSQNSDNYDELDEDLSHLSEQLALRIELEDELISTLFQKH